MELSFFSSGIKYCLTVTKSMSTKPITNICSYLILKLISQYQPKSFIKLQCNKFFPPIKKLLMLALYPHMWIQIFSLSLFQIIFEIIPTFKINCCRTIYVIKSTSFQDKSICSLIVPLCLMASSPKPILKYFLSIKP